LVDVAQDAIITERDCKTLDGIYIGSLVEGGEIIEPVGDRILGRVIAEDIRDPFTNDVLLKKNTELTEDHVKIIDDAGIEKVKIRSVLTCRAKPGICVKCYGRDLGRGQVVNMGEAVGVIAAQSIGEPGTQLTMRTFHVGGTATRMAEQSTLSVKNDGTIKFHNLVSVKSNSGQLVVTNRNGELIVEDESGREREKYMLTYGARLKVKEGGSVKSGQLVAEWDPYTMPILTQVGGRVKYSDLIENSTLKEQVDSVTGLSRKVIVESKDAELKPEIRILDAKGKVAKIPGTEIPARYLLPVGANLYINDGDEIGPGDVLAKIPRETTKTKDITGGLPRVAELFEARKPKEIAVVSEIDGIVSFGKDTKGKRKVVITPEVGTPSEYLIPKGKHISVHEGDFVRAGEALMDGSSNPHDIIRILGVKDLAKYLVDEVQEVYRLQGVKINDKHIEVIVRQMLKKIRVTDAGDTDFVKDEEVNKTFFEETNESMLKQKKKPASGVPMLLGITKASLNTDSFISAASFQETTKVFTEASINAKVDYLKGLKENVIMGRLIPAGTGIPVYESLGINVAGVETPIEDTHANETMVPGAQKIEKADLTYLAP
jgi:DNA-directed RNA polymerase subunit beta'